MDEATKQTYEEKRQEREQARTEKRRQSGAARTQKRLVRYVVGTTIVVAAGYGLFLWAQSAGPDGEDFSVAYDIQGRQHIADGSPHPEYNSNPPSSGWHYASPARGGFYEEPLPDERVVHNLEHGDIWIAFHLDIPESARDTLESFAGRYVVVSPRPENKGDIALVAWGRVDTFDIENGVVDEGRIRDFIKRYDDRGPERLRGVQPSHGF